MLKVVRKNKSYNKRKLVIYDDKKKLVEAQAFFGWFSWSNSFPYRTDKDTWRKCRYLVLQNLYWLCGKDCSYADWVGRIEKWHKGRGLESVSSDNSTSQFFNGDELHAALDSFEE